MIDPQAITEAVWAARGPSIFLREDCTKSRQQQSNEIAWMNGSQPAHKGVEVAGKGLGKRRDYDVNAMVHMRRQGYEWREIASRYDVSVNTCRNRVQSIAPDLLPMRRSREPGPRNQIVLRTKADAVKTGRIKGTGVAS